MKIYYVINGRLPTEKANGYQVSQMCQAFLENGVSVTLLRPDRKLSKKLLPFSENLKGFYNLRRDIDVRTIWSIDFQYYCHRISHLFDIFQPIMNILHTLTFIVGLAIFFKRRNRTNADILYLRDINIISWIFPFLDVVLKNNIVLELHYLPEAKIKRERYIRILKKAKVVVTITHKMKQDLISLGLPEQKIWVEHDAVDLPSFKIDLSQAECRRRIQFPEGDFIVGYVGNFHTNGKEKGVDDLLKAAVTVLKQRPHVKFYFVGGPMDRVPAYINLLDSLGLSRESFVFRDRVNVAEVPIVMAACDILTIPLPWNQYFAYYMSPMKLFEYMASNRCIVATDVESIKEVLSDKVNALLASHSNILDLSRNIILAADESELRKKLSAQALHDVEHYSWKKRSDRILNFFEKTKRTSESINA